MTAEERIQRIESDIKDDRASAKQDRHEVRDKLTEISVSLAQLSTKVEGMRKDISDFSLKSEGMMSKKNFYWITGVLIGIVSAVFANLWGQIIGQDKASEELKEQIAAIRIELVEFKSEFRSKWDQIQFIQ